jgi:uncharacterized protein
VIREALRLRVAREVALPTRPPTDSPRKDKVLAKLVALEEPLRKQGLISLALFGSVVRSTARPDSDIDVLIDVAPDAGFSLIDLVAVKDFLEDQLGRRVDVETRRRQSPISRRILRGMSSRGFAWIGVRDSL